MISRYLLLDPFFTKNKAFSFTLHILACVIVSGFRRSITFVEIFPLKYLFNAFMQNHIVYTMAKSPEPPPKYSHIKEVNMCSLLMVLYWNKHVFML